MGQVRSLPTRGAWIEIDTSDGYQITIDGRSPHGERGLKSDIGETRVDVDGVAPHTGSVD